jgi:hypothetical protein
MSSGSPASCTLSSLIDLVSGVGGGIKKGRKGRVVGTDELYGALPRLCLPTAPGTIFDQGCMVMSSGSPASCNLSSLIDLEKSSRDAPADGGGGKGARARVPPQLDNIVGAPTQPVSVHVHCQSVQGPTTSHGVQPERLPATPSGFKKAHVRALPCTLDAFQGGNTHLFTTSSPLSYQFMLAQRLAAECGS